MVPDKLFFHPNILNVELLGHHLLSEPPKVLHEHPEHVTILLRCGGTRSWRILLKNQAIRLCSYASYY